MSITVQVISDPGSGKTTIAREIQRHLNSLGFECSVIDDEESADEAHRTRVQSLVSKRPLVVVVTVQRKKAHSTVHEGCTYPPGQKCRGDDRCQFPGQCKR